MERQRWRAVLAGSAVLAILAGGCAAPAVTLVNETDRPLLYRFGKANQTSFGGRYGWQWDRAQTLEPSRSVSVLTSNLDNNRYTSYEMVSVTPTLDTPLEDTLLLKINGGTTTLRLGVGDRGQVVVRNEVPASWRPFGGYLLDPRTTPEDSR